VTIRAATPDDLDLLLSLVERLERELPPLPYAEDPVDVERTKIERMVTDGVALLAEEGGKPIAYALARYGDHGPTTVYVTDLWVDAPHRGRGLGRELLSHVAEAASARGCTHLLLDVDSRNREAVAFYERVGFEEDSRILRTALDGLLAEPSEPGESIGAVHVQTDDAESVERVVDDYLPRVLRGATATVERGRAWTVVRLDRFDRAVMRKLGLELSFRFGVTVVLALEESAVVRFVIHDRGRMIDEYLSLPEYYGPLPPGDVLALRANPTVVARLTGAQAAHVRAVAQTGASAADLPAPAELYAQVAEALGLTP